MSTFEKLNQQLSELTLKVNKLKESIDILNEIQKKREKLEIGLQRLVDNN